MRDVLTHIDELIGAWRVNHTAAGGPDLSGLDQVKRGIRQAAPGTKSFVCVSPDGWIDIEQGGSLTGWEREYTLTAHFWAASARNTPEARITAAVNLAHVLEQSAYAAFQDEVTPSSLYLQTHRFRVTETKVLDLHELGSRAPWGFGTMQLSYRAQGPDGGP